MQKVMTLLGTMVLVGATIGFCINLEGVLAKIIAGVLGTILIGLFLWKPTK